jgi:hypothetical protein
MRDERVAAHQGLVTAALQVDPVEVLVKPDRDLGALTQDEPAQRAGLGLGSRAGARVEDAAKGPPGPGEVAVEVDAVGVAARARRTAVRVGTIDEQQLDAWWWLCGA